MIVLYRQGCSIACSLWVHDEQFVPNHLLIGVTMVARRRLVDLDNNPEQRPTLVIDANVFMGAGNDPFKVFQNSDIVVPVPVIEDLERHRGDDGGIGWACRSVLGHIEQLRISHQADAIYDVNMNDENGNTLCIAKEIADDIPPELRNGRSSSAVIAITMTLCRTRDNVVLISNSLPTRLRANGHHLRAEPYADDTFQPFDGRLTANVRGTIHDLVYVKKARQMALAEVDRQCHDGGYPTPAHAAVVFTHIDGQQQVILKSNEGFRQLDYNIHAGNVRPRPGNLDQVIALNYLMDESIQAVSLGGIAGSGKSILALAAGMAQVECGKYDRIMVFRSMHSVANQDVGFLPGDLNDKIAPWAQAVWDNVDQIDRINGRIKKRNYRQDAAKQAVRSNIDEQTASAQERHAQDILVQPVTYLRGRTFVKTFIIVDDAQSLDRSTILDIITRLGRESKIVFTHDMSQQDNPYISIGTSMLSVINDLVCQSVFAHLDFTKSERSELAQIAADLLAKESL